MKITPALRERFCKDLQLPIKIFTDPYFMERLVLYDIHFGCWEKYIDFEKMLEDYADEQEYFEAYNSLKETVIQYLLNNPDFTFFSQTEDMSKFAIPNRSLPKNSIYKQTMIGKHFVSFDLCKGNFTALHHYNEKIFDGAHTYEEFLSKFTSNKHFIESKYIRQVIFGTVNPKRQVRYEEYLMNQVLDTVLEKFATEKIVYFSTDEIVVELDEKLSETSELYTFISNTVNHFIDNGITLRAEVFELDHIKEYDAYIKRVYCKMFQSSGDTIKKSELLVIKNATNLTMPFVLRHLYKLPPSENDNVFFHEGRLAKFIE